MAPKQKTVRVAHNIWGNYNCFVGRERIEKFGVEFDAKCWLAAQIKAGHAVSDKSVFSAQHVQEYLQYVD